MPRSSSKFLSADDVAAAALHAHLHVELAVLGDGRDVGVRLEDLDVAVGLDVARAHFAGLVDRAASASWCDRRAASAESASG